jgi:hypothetical protein
MGRPTKYDLSQIVRTAAEIKVWNHNISTNTAIHQALDYIFTELLDRPLSGTKRSQLFASVTVKYSKIGPALEGEIRAQPRPRGPVMPTLLTAQGPEESPRRELAAEFGKELHRLHALANRLEREDDPRLVSDVRTIIAAIRSALTKRDKQKARVAKQKHSDKRG